MKISVLAAAPFRFAAALWRSSVYLAKGRPVIAPESVRRERMANCIGCPHNEHGLCLKCGCLIDAKVMLSSEECPDTPPRWERLR